MFSTTPYNPTSLMRFQVSMLNLCVALERSVPIGSKDVAAGTSVEAAQLENLIESHDRQKGNNLQSSSDSSRL